MLEVPAAVVGETHLGGPSAPAVTADGRSFARGDGPPLDGDPDLALWYPQPPQDGDPVYCGGIHVGTFRGEFRTSDHPSGLLHQHWYIETFPTKDIPPCKWRDYLLQQIRTR